MNIQLFILIICVEKLFASHGSLGAQLFLGGEEELPGGHKGYGLGLMFELFSSALSLGRWSKHTFEGTGSGITHFFGAISLDLYRRVHLETAGGYGFGVWPGNAVIKTIPN